MPLYADVKAQSSSQKKMFLSQQAGYSLYISGRHPTSALIPYN